jgi:hypothetical protein
MCGEGDYSVSAGTQYSLPQSHPSKEGNCHGSSPPLEGWLRCGFISENENHANFSSVLMNPVHFFLECRCHAKGDETDDCRNDCHD